MRSSTSPARQAVGAVLVLLLMAAGCSSDAGEGSAGGGVASSERFCDIMQEFVDLADEALRTATTAGEDELTALMDRVTELVSEAEEAAPAEIADIIQSTELPDQDLVTQYVSDECGVDLPELN